MANINWSAVLQALALFYISIICGLLIFFKVPDENSQVISFGLGAIAGVLTTAGASKVNEAIKSSSDKGVDQ